MLLVFILLRCWIAFLDGCAEASGRVDSGEIISPGMACGRFVLVLQPGKVILEGWRPGQSAGVALMAVEGQEILQQDGTRPAIAEQVMLSEQESMAVRSEAEKRGAEERRLVDCEATAAVLGFDFAGETVAFIGLEGAEIVFPPGHGATCMHDLEGPSAAMQMEVDAKIGMAIEQSVQSAAQANGVEDAVEFKSELDEIGI